MIKLTEEMVNVFGFAANDPEIKVQDALRGLEAVLEIVNREPDSNHAWQEWNTAGNSCHVLNCRLGIEEHEA